jgi:hypothetical protein
VAKSQQKERYREDPSNPYYLIAHDAAAPYRFQRGDVHRRKTGVNLKLAPGA